MPDNDDEWAACLFEFSVSRLDQLAPDALALVFGKYGHRAQRRPLELAANNQRAVHDVAHHLTVQGRN